MITLETAIAKIKQLPTEDQKEIIRFVEFLEFKSGKATPFLTCEAVFTETCFLARANELQSFFNQMIITLVQLNLVKKLLAVIISIFLKGFKTNKS